MRAREFVNESRLLIDVPNEEWLADKVDWAKKKGRNSFGVPYLGSVTARPSDRNLRLPVSLLKQLPGMRAEQQNVRREDLKTLMKIMQDTGKLPLMDNGEEYRPFINVAWNGEAWVNEGNHRIMAATTLGWKDLPVELAYFDGGERIESGPLYPKKIGLQQGVAEGPVNEFVDVRGGDGGGNSRPDIRVKYLHGQDFLVTINGHKYSLSVSRLEMSLKDPSMHNKIYGVPGNPHEIKPEYRDARYWNLDIANATIEDVKGQRPAAEIEDMVDEIITKDHQADLAQIYNYHQELNKKDPDWWFTKYQMPKPQRVSDFVKKK